MEPSGRNRWQPVANGTTLKSAQTRRSAPVPRAGGLERGEYLALLGALSGVVGFMLAESGESAG
jgi:hypothetical protein